MNGRIWRQGGWTFLLLLLVMGGCASRHFQEVNYYSLFHVDQLDGYHDSAKPTGIRLGMGPLTLVDSLRRSQIVTRNVGNVYSFNDYHKWAGSLEQDLVVTLGKDLEHFTGASSIEYYPWPQFFQPTHRVVVDIERLDGVLGKEAVIEARWRVLSPDGKSVLAGGRWRHVVAVNGAGYGDLVRAQSQLVARLAGEIGRAIMNKLESTI